jgi:stage II sporulation protein D
MRAASLLTALILVGTVASFQSSHAAESSTTDVRIGVLGLFHPHELEVKAVGTSALVLSAGKDNVTLDPSSGVASATIRFAEDGVVLLVGTQTLRASRVAAAGRRNEPTDFVLEVPGKIARRYHGTLQIGRAPGELVAIITMDREIAAASVVAAESTRETPFEALKAQAVAARSYLAAGRGRHHGFDFCDTTHCQFLREPPSENSPAMRATHATRGLVIAYDSRPLAAMYTRSCSGRTRTAAELGLPAARYPYFSVDCNYCRSHPALWSRQLSPQDALALRASDERSRLELVRRQGWDTVPSNDFRMKTTAGKVEVEGVGVGHGIGLCQAGASAMAAAGSNFREILSHYYPNTTTISMPGAH